MKSFLERVQKRWPRKRQVNLVQDLVQEDN